MKPCDFEYVLPADLNEALAALENTSDRDAKVLAGGQSLIPMMNFRTLAPEVLIDINQLTELDYCRVEGRDLLIGALTRHNTLKNWTAAHDVCPLIRDAYEHVAHHTVRNRGTIGGNLSHADPASEMPAVMLAYDAQFVLRSSTSTRTVRADEFFISSLQTSIAPNELLVEIRVPLRRTSGWAFEEVSSRKGDFAIVAVAVLMELSNGKCIAVSISLSGVTDRSTRVYEAEGALIGTRVTADRIDAALTAIGTSIDFTDSPGVSSEYRKHLANTLAGRAIRTAFQRASEAQ
ncbi:xanthine dehydrogenase family protein subunit M [Pseudomonas sp. PDM32]|uniref:FAD binding domain-containing protein n=1 Tax=Pseudomonas sp. PDM32 TaxID=2854768 RepID=UPI001C441D72|nr:xanthine dehydrogenase family protein subunit M [Pseudomonas sp. PDM32]MBV7573239.1 xanthine dehydrogenase family protein subunit M [Pseudomonas sp. PDM32]